MFYILHQVADLLKMILPWVLLFSLLTIHAENYKPTPGKVWIQAKQQRDSNPDLNSKLLGPMNGELKETLQQSFPNHDIGRNLPEEPSEKFSGKSSDANPKEKPKSPTMTVSMLTMFRAMERIKKYSAREQMKFNTKGIYPTKLG